MSLTNRELARLGELLDEALPLTPEERWAWLDSLSSGDQPLVRTLRDELLAEETGAGGPLDRPPRIDTGSAEEGAVAGRHAGERLGAYELLRPLGSGGMADVWLACRTDGAFERQVALKIPRVQSRPVEMTARFALECNILAKLEYPGIARLYDAGVDASGVPYIAMEYVRGEPLVAWCDARGLDKAARIQVFLQVLDVVAYAHGRHVIHRDLKPSNILVTGQGEVRLLDFGMARLLQPETDAALLTRVYGLALTPEYASPEMLRGESIDSRSDIYSLGVVLHELLTGARPVQPTRPATGDTTRLHGALRDVVSKALQPDPGDRYPDAASFAATLRPFADGRAHELSGRLKTRSLSVGGLAALAALVGMAALLTWTQRQRGQERWAREDALPRLQALIAADDYAAAFDLAREIERVTPRDPVLRELEPSFSAKVRLDTAPGGAKVFYRPYAGGDKDWRLIGETPLEEVAVPIGVGLWRIEKEGHDTALLALRNPGVQLGNAPDADVQQLMEGVDLAIPLAHAATSPDGMVLVPAIPALIPGGDLVEVPAFFIDRFEVRNQDFKEFVDARGYTESGHWRDLPFDGGDWQTAVATFVDLTGRPGPSTWRAGTHPDGTADYPVTGISWYEAAAYCRFRGKELPTAYHWYRAAGSIIESWESVSSAIVHGSNFGGRELAPVGRFGSVGPHGTYDMAGNAREWLWTQGSVGRWVAGGAFDEPRYVYLQPGEAPPVDRSAANGFRCMQPAQAGPANEDLRRPVVAQAVDYAAMEPVGDAAYAVLAQQLDYRATAMVPRVGTADSSHPAWTVDRITLPTGYDNTSFAVQLFLPTDRRSPSGVIFYLPHVGEFTASVTTERFDPATGGVPLDFLPKSGWALAVVAFDGAFERQWSAERMQSMNSADRFRLRLRHWREELGRTIDYLTTREDIDARRLGWFGISYGASVMLPLLAVEKRIGAAVLYGGGVGLRSDLPASEQAYNYVPRVTQPVLMLSGRWDIDATPDAQQRLFELLGSPAHQKKHALFEAGHGNLPRFQVEQETLEWFDRHLVTLAQADAAVDEGA
ncbi:MAG TPA: bifunctional serine/threonine-protein kinase/formylglycine-generating enzyme family protein [Steroidobacteraceae bacterium]|nr:bifunctional serine/threonine-protein kinase/formylglycine-generating enzyme family protein [Steroidobacteraceae bacterium]